tara:strand:- start:11 stop:289 length:279 start_codon:yes stop_codon:yes gene_type:complete
MKKIVDGILMDLTAEDLAQRETDIASRPSELNMALLSLRSKRNSLLAQTDWWGASDNTMTDAQKKYRQDLRDITEGLDTVDKVNAVVWPTKP